MRLNLAYTLKFLSKPPLGLNVPLKIEIQEKVFRIEEFDENKLQASAFVECSIDADSLYLRVGEKPIDGSEPNREIDVPERGELSHFLTVMVNIISFLIDVPLRISHRIGYDQLIAESEEDHLKLESLGTSQIYQHISMSMSVRSVSLSTLTDDALEKLFQKELGVALYRQALLLQEPIGAYREFWKILESAFGTKDNELIQLLSEYKPAIQLGFTQEELKKLLILRGRASHAESRSGINEHQFVNSQISKVLPRLKCLVEQVIVTKKTWGTPTLEIERIADISGFIKEDGTPVLIKGTSE